MRKFIPFFMTLIIFALLLYTIDFKQVTYHIINIDLFYLLVAILLYIPLFFIYGSRWKLLISKNYNISLGKSIKVLLAGAPLNLLTPLKLGDFARAYILKKEGKLPLKKGVSGVLLEKLLDLNFLCFFSIMGVILLNVFNNITFFVLLVSFSILLTSLLFCIIDFSKIKILKILISKIIKNNEIKKGFAEIPIYFSEIKNDKKLFFNLLISSLFIWFINLLQIYFLFLSVGYLGSIELIFSFVPIAILIGLLPITIGGLGTTQAALVVLFTGFASPALVLSAGILISLRYYFLALLGLPWLKDIFK